jgi:hypothetical protein
MQQRQPRLGDIVDDYCPRERRITNHAVVAMVGDEVRQTRCTTCDSEHEFKQAKVPPQRRKKEVTGALYQQVLAGMPRKVVPAGLESQPDSSDDVAVMVEAESEVIPEERVEERQETAPVAVAVDDSDGPVHRPLIRATLPRLNDDPPQRREPDFTMRGPGGPRPGKFGKNGFRGHRPGGHGGHQANGNRAMNGNRDATGNRPPGGKRHHGHGPHRPSGGRPGAPHGSGRGPRPGGHGRGGKKSPR